MGSAGIAIGPDGKPIKKQDKQMSRGHRGGKKVREQRGAAGMPIGVRPFRPAGMGGGGGPMRGPRMMVGHGNSAMMRVPGPVGPGMGITPLMSALRGSPNGPGNAPRGVNDNFGFFRDVNPQRPVGLMSEDRTCPMHSGSTPSAASVGRGSIGNGSFGSGAQTGQVQPNSSSAPNMGNEVPGFGTNSSIHELFGKMVWRKMEGLRDEAVIDRLQNRIMNLIHDALADQNNASVGNGTSGTAPTNGMSGRDASHQSPLNFRSF